MSYGSKDLTGKYFTMRGFFLMWIPVAVPYGKILQEAKKRGYNIDENENGMIIEKGKSFGFGWIGVKVNDSAAGKGIVSLNGKFKTYEHIGSYKQMGKSFDVIMKENKNLNEFYSIYLNSPGEAPEAELRTLICFR